MLLPEGDGHAALRRTRPPALRSDAGVCAARDWQARSYFGGRLRGTRRTGEWEGGRAAGGAGEVAAEGCQNGPCWRGSACPGRGRVGQRFRYTTYSSGGEVRAADGARTSEPTAAVDPAWWSRNLPSRGPGESDRGSRHSAVLRPRGRSDARPAAAQSTPQLPATAAALRRAAGSGSWAPKMTASPKSARTRHAVAARRTESLFARSIVMPIAVSRTPIARISRATGSGTEPSSSSRPHGRAINAGRTRTLTP
ncbi:hypothetical protein YW3DRAFT_07094 [Streptomyces sp. MnatMP-M77]|nr:hypothetical protein YW3DRAFT_07094 [Streptomyces sp. MnatMP-M77]